jgi:hypothetical protein
MVLPYYIAGMITTAQLQEFIGMRPFRRFALETTGGNYVIVETADHIKLPPPNLEAILVYGTDGVVHYLTIDSIANAAVYGATPKTNHDQPNS